MNMEDIFSQFGDIFGGGFGGGGFGGFGQQRGGRTVKGSNLRVRLKMSLEDVANGAEKKIKVTKLVRAKGSEYGTCSTCGGNGQVRRVQNTFLGQMQTVTTCPACGGIGRSVTKRAPGSDEHGLIREEVVVPIQIPAGVEEGMQLNINGMFSVGKILSIAPRWAVPNVSLACRNTAVFRSTFLALATCSISLTPLVTSCPPVGKLRTRYL